MNPPTTPEISESAVGDILGGKYRILEEIDQGGMGRVYKALQIALNREVAIKVILSANNAKANGRFLLEASLTANLSHPNIVRVFDFGRTEDGVLFLVMELLTGKNLEHWVRETGPLSVEDALAVAKDLCGALAEAHTQHVIHRDIKPSNIILSQRPGSPISAKLIDFGLVKSADQNSGLSQSGMLLGTPMYMAPEQITAQGVDDRVDIYALGMTLYYALTGHNPYPSLGLDALMHAQLNTMPESIHSQNPEIHPQHMIHWIIECAISKDVGDRFSNALQMREALEVCETHLTSPSFPPLEMKDGVLTSQDDRVVLNASTPTTPLVDQDSYALDGSTISSEFASAITQNVPLESYSEFLSDNSLSSLALPPGTAPSAPSSKTRNGLLGLGILLALGGGVTALLSKSPPPVAPEAPAIERVEVRVESVPEGADVLQENRLVGSTPFTMDLQPQDSPEIELRLEGYQPRVVSLSSQSPSVVVRLSPTAKSRGKTGPQPKAVPVQKAAPQVVPQEQSPTNSKPPPKTKSTEPAEGPRDPWAD